MKKIDRWWALVVLVLVAVVMAGCGGNDFPEPQWVGGPTGGAPDPGLLNTLSRGFSGLGRALTDGMFSLGWLVGFWVILLLPGIIFAVIPGVLAGDREPRIEAKVILTIAGVVLALAIVFESWGLVAGVNICCIIPAIILWILDDEDHKVGIFGIPAYVFFLFYLIQTAIWIEEHPLQFVGVIVGGVLLTIMLFSGKSETH